MAERAGRASPGLTPLGRDAAPALQRLYDACADYFVHAHGQPAHASAAAEEFDDLPAGVPPQAKFVLGWHGAPGRCDAMIEGVRDYPQAGIFYLGLMLVRPELRARGTGSALVQGFEAWAHAAGAREIRLCVFDGSTAARRFWQRNGYTFHRAVARAAFGRRQHARTELRKLLSPRRAAG